MDEVLLDRGRNQGGVTLIEVMIAVMVLSVALLSSMSLVASEWQLVERTQEILYVSQILETRSEELRSFSFDDLEGLEDGTAFELSPFVTLTGEDLIGDDQEMYEMALREGEGHIYFDVLDQDLIKATVVISFIPARDDNRIYMRNCSYIARNGVGQ